MSNRTRDTGMAVVMLSALSWGCAVTEYASPGEPLPLRTDAGTGTGRFSGVAAADLLAGAAGAKDESFSLTTRLGGMIPISSDLGPGFSAHFDFGWRLPGAGERVTLLLGAGSYRTSKSGTATDPFIGSYECDIQIDVAPITLDVAFRVLPSENKMDLYLLGGLGYYMARSQVEAFGVSNSGSAGALGLQLGGGVAWSAGRSNLGVDLTCRIANADFGTVGQGDIGGLAASCVLGFHF